MTKGLSSTNDSMNSPPSASQKSGAASWITSILSEPLLHFLLIGALLFGGYTYLQNDTRSTPQNFVVSAGKIEHLASLFSRTWQRPPTRIELDGLIDDYVREEIAYREGMKMGLDEDDTIIRRRIRQKLDFIADDLGSQIEPTEEQLTTFLNEHPAYSLGFVMGTGLLHAAGIGIGCIGHWPWGKRCLRAAGALVMVSGVYFLISSLGYFA